MRHFIFCLGCLLCLFSAKGQELKLSYFGESITHYGLKGAYSRELRDSQKETKKGRSINHSFSFAPGLAVYRHPQNHVGVLMLPELSYQRKRGNGRFLEAGLAPGVFRTFLEGKTFVVGPEGELEHKKLAGRLAFMPTVFIGFGRDLSLTKELPLSWYTRINLMKQLPYNASSLTRFALEIGISKPLTF